VAEITAFPRGTRVMGVHGRMSGFALDESEAGVCLSVDAAIPVGALLRIELRDFDGEIVRDEIVRVAWCRSRDRGRFAIGAELVAESARASAPTELTVEHRVRRVQVDVTHGQ
jgi:hypothetical protein